MSEPLRARIGIHTGVAELRDDDYFGSAVNRAGALGGDRARRSDRCAPRRRPISSATRSRTAVDLVDLGEHRLRDLSRPERVFQVMRPGWPTTFPPLRSLDAFPGNLPLQLTSFVGATKKLPRWRLRSRMRAW